TFDASGNPSTWKPAAVWVIRKWSMGCLRPNVNRNPNRRRINRHFAHPSMRTFQISASKQRRGSQWCHLTAFYSRAIDEWPATHLDRAKDGRQQLNRRVLKAAVVREYRRRQGRR